MAFSWRTPMLKAGSLGRDRATVPTVSKRHRGVDQRAVSLARSLLKVEEERSAAEKTAVAIAEKDRRAPLRTAQVPGSLPARVGILGESRNQLNRPRVVKTLKRLHQRSPDAEGRGESAHASTARIEVRAQIDKEVRAGTVAGLDVERRKAPRDASIAKTGKRVDWIKLIPPSRVSTRRQKSDRRNTFRAR